MTIKNTRLNRKSALIKPMQQLRLKSLNRLFPKRLKNPFYLELRIIDEVMIETILITISATKTIILR